MPAANDGAFQRAIDFLAGLTNRERLAPDRARVSDLRPMLELLAALGNPGADLPVVQIGGTKGKGTTALLIERLAEALSIPTGTFLSPHLRRVTERIRHRGAELAAGTFGRSVLEVEPAARRMSSPPSWFEVVTAAALVHFARVRPGLVILEVGLGGRLDSTSAVDHRASVITGIGLEHMEVLGATLEEIAREKAGLIRPSRPCVTGASGPALGVIEDAARRKGAPLLRLGREVVLGEEPTGSGFAVRLTTPRGGRRSFEVGLASRVHVWSLALAVAAVEEAFPETAPAITGELLAATFASVRLEGRFELLPPRRPGAPRVLLDSAHTAESIAHLFADLALRFPGAALHLVFGCASDKRWRQGLSAIAGRVDRAYVAPISSPRSEDPGRIAEHLRALGVPVSEHPRGLDAFLAAERAAGAGALIVVTGSGYLVGEVSGQFDTGPTGPP